jgi:putative flippase GtrA
VRAATPPSAGATGAAGPRRSLRGPVGYLVVGGASYLVDVGLLVLLHHAAGAPLWLATTVGYWCSVVVNFTGNRLVLGRAGAPVGRSAVRYGVLLALNYGVTVLTVAGLAAAGVEPVVAKTGCVVVLAVVNYLVYRRWVFR